LYLSVTIKKKIENKNVFPFKYLKSIVYTKK
jgi:hypothetical protein